MVIKRWGGNEWRVKELEDSLRALRRSIARTQTALKSSPSRSERQHFQELLRCQQEEFAKIQQKAMAQPKATTKLPDKIRLPANTKPPAIPDFQRSHVLSLPPEDLPLNSFSFRAAIPLLILILLLVGGLSLMLLIDPWRQDVTGSSTYALVGTGITHFTAEQQPQFRVQLAEKKGNELTGNFMAIPQELEIRAWLIDPEGQEKRLEREISVTPESLQIQLPQSRQLRPGLYTLKVSAQQQGQQYDWQQDFTWGVLALNTDKAEYRENEEAFISMAVLDDKGKMVCDAALTLTITAPDDTSTVLSTSPTTTSSTSSTLSTKNGGITISPDCDKYAVTPLPDYYAKVRLGRAGTYRLHLTASIPDGQRSINQFLEVQQAWKKKIAYEVTRMGPTRIYPPLKYEMAIEVIPYQLFRGTIQEEVPSSFTVLEQEGMSVAEQGETKTISWEKQLLIPGQIKEYRYQFIAPPLSPEFYLLGPLSMDTSLLRKPWQEPRFWQIAADLLPTQGAPIINSTNEQRNTTQSNITVYQQSVTTGQNIKNITTWRINGTSIMLINMPFEGINNTASNNAWDYSGYGYNGTESGGIAWNSTAGFDGRGAYEFDGFNDIIVLPNSFTAQPSTVLTITAWIFPKNCTNNMRIVTKGVQLSGPGDTTGQIIFDTTGGQNVGCGINFAFTNNTGTQESTPVSGRVLNPREWYFVAVTFNNSNMTTYVNGDIQTSNYTNSLQIPASSSFNWTVGEVEAYSGSPMSPTTVFNGTIDELRIYNRSLSHAQIIALWKNRTDLIVSEELRPQQNWSAVVTLNNGTGDGQSVLSNALRIVANNTPTHDKAPVLNTTNLKRNDSTTNLTLYTYTRDPDADPLKNITNWLVDGNSIMVLYLPFEGINGTSYNNTKDYSGNDQNATEIGGIVWNATGGFDGRGAYQFTSSTDSIQVNDTDGLFNATNMTIAAWIRPDYGGATMSGQIVSKASFMSGLFRFNFRVSSANINFFWNPLNCLGTVTLSDGKWYHVVGTHNNTNTAIYVNGVVDTVCAGEISVKSSISPLIIGDRAAYDQSFEGAIDELMIFNRTLSPQQIAALYQNKTNIIVPQEMGAVGEVWSAVVTPNDGLNDGASLSSNTVTILSGPPRVTVPTLSTTNTSVNGTDQNLTLSYGDLASMTPEAVKNITTWLINGSSIMLLQMPFEGINKTSSNNAWDYSGYGNNGTERGGVVWNSTGGFDGWGAYTFDGSDDYINLTNNSAPNLNPLTAITIAAWVNPIVGGEQRAIIGRWNAGGYSYLMDIVSGLTRFIIRNSADTQGVWTGTTQLKNNTWYFIVGTYNTTNIQLYVNGVAEGSLSSGSVPNTMSTNSEPTYIGKKGDDATVNFRGTLDEITIWNRSLTAPQIRALFRNNTNTTVAQETERGNNWSVIVIPNNGDEDGDFVRSNSLVILNIAPAHLGVPVLNTTDILSNGTRVNLTLYPQNISDIENDRIKNITTWFINGSSIMILNMPFERINNSDTNNIWDYSGKGNNGSEQGGVVWNSTGGFDGLGAYEFDGIDDYINLGNSSELNLTNSYSLEVRVKYGGPVNGNRTIYRRSGTYGVLLFVSNGNGSIYFEQYNQSLTRTTVISPLEYNDSRWHHVVGTYNHTAMGLYVDGAIVAANMSARGGVYAPTYQSSIGRNSHLVTGNWSGTIDEIRIWNRSLSMPQILALFNNKTDLIVAEETYRGNNWTASVVPNDGFKDGPPLLSVRVSILNTIPNQTALVLNTTDPTSNNTAQNLTLYPTIDDPDEDNIKNITTWFLNGTSVLMLNMPFEGINRTKRSTTNNAWDYSGNGYNGSEQLGVTWNATDGFDGKGAYKFDGLDNYINISDSDRGLTPKLNITGSQSIEARVKFGTAMRGNQTIYHRGNAKWGAFLFVLTNGEASLSFKLYNQSGALGEATSSSGYNDSRWHHVVGTYNSSAVGLYVDGAIVASSSFSGPVYYPIDRTVIGRANKTIGNWTGMIDEVRVWNRSLSSEQILALFSNRTDLFLSQELGGGQNWTAINIPNDGLEDGPPLRSNQVIITTVSGGGGNSAPSVSSLILNTTDVTKNDTTTNLTLYISASDADGDSIKNITNWLVNGSSIMVLNMPFEEINSTTSNNAWDYSGNGRNGTNNSDIVWNATGGYDGRGAYEFDGTNDFINISYSAALNVTKNITLAAWVRPLSLATKPYILAKASTTLAQPFVQYALYFDNNCANAFELALGIGGTLRSLCGTTTGSVGSWYHIVGTYDGNNRSIYVNGVLENSAAAGGITGELDSYTTPVLIGKLDTDTTTFQGTIDDVRIYNRSLTPEQILALYNNKTNLIVSQELSHAQNWTADVTPNDGRVDGAFARSNQQIIRNNRAPTQTAPILNTTDLTKNDTSTNLTLYLNVSDADGDSIKNITNWLLNGTSIMVLNMPFEGINGTASNNAWDYSGNGRNGTEGGGLVWNSTGGYDGRGAYEFDGTNDFINISYNAVLNVTKNITLAAWVRPLSLATKPYILAKASTTLAQPFVQYALYFDNNCANAFELALGIGGTLRSLCGTTTGSVGSWYHIVGTYDGNNRSIYVNGVLENSAAAGGITGELDSYTTPVLIGKLDTDTTTFQGTIDDVRIYNRSLTLEQIQALYNNKTNLIVSQELSSGQNWTADVIPNDGRVDGVSARSNQVIIAAVSGANSRPTVPITGRPFNGSAITNRTPAFEWFNATDADSDPISYHIQVDDNIRFTNPEINVSAILDQNSVASGNTSWYSNVELTVDTTYYWRVRANDSGGFGSWSNGLTDDGPGDAPYNLSNFTLDSLIQITMINNAVEFGSVAPGTEVNTSDGVPPPFRAENTGNVNVNATINGSTYLTSIPINRSNYQFKVRANESGAFDTALSTTSYANMTNSTSQFHVVNLTWRNSRNDFLLDINLTIPTDEPGGLKTSTVTFSFTRNE